MKKRWKRACVAGWMGLMLAGCQPAPAPQGACDTDKACAVDAPQVESGLSDPQLFERALTFFENGESGVLYFGFADCPWCQEAVPVLKEEAEKAGRSVVFIQTRDENRELEYTDEQKARITPYIEEYMSENDEGELTLFVPCVLVVENGTVVSGHVGTVDGHDAHERTMTDAEKEQLHQTYAAMLR